MEGGSCCTPDRPLDTEDGGRRGWPSGAGGREIRRPRPPPCQGSVHSDVLAAVELGKDLVPQHELQLVDALIRRENDKELTPPRPRQGC